MGHLKISKGVLEMEHHSLCRGYVRGTWRWFFSGECDKYVKKALDMDTILHVGAP
jgi:hypothetical protein